MADNARTKTGPSYRQPDICREAMRHYQLWYERELDNINAAYDDLEFRAGNQWPADVIVERTTEKRPMLTINRLPQFVRQVTGDMRRNRPGIKVVPVDSRGDPDTADVLAGMIRYVENRSEASAIYTTAADTQVVAGIGHWKVITEYAGDTTFEQELRIVGVADSIAVAWDPDAILPTREDARWCLVPVDVTRESFTEQWPDCPVEDFDTLPGTVNSGASYGSWYSKEMIRIGEYWKKVPIKRKLALLPDGGIDDLTDESTEPEEQGERRENKLPPGTRIEERDGWRVMRYLVTAAHLLEETEWVGRNIPVIPAIGEEVRIGRRTVRHGLVRFAKDSQRSYNYFSTAHAEVVGLQPKAPFIGTEKNFERYQEEWSTSNRKNWPYLPFSPDPANGGKAPERVPPPLASSGIIQGIQLANEDMKAVIGIYDASLGAKSNETSGRAILARQKEGDVGTYVYIDNFNRAVRRTGAILVDLIPHIYDTERQIRIMGEDGHVELKWINRGVGMGETDPTTGQQLQEGEIENDVTIGAYDVVMDNGPSYTTKLAEARDGMTAFVQAAPAIAPAVMDLIAQSQDWPLKEEFAERLKVIAPPPVQQLIQKKEAESGQQQPQVPPTPQEQMQAQLQQAQLQMQMQAAQLDLENKQLQNDKLKADIVAEVTAQQAAQAPQTLQALDQGPQALAAQQQMIIADQQAARDHEIHQHKIAGMALDNQAKHMAMMRQQAELQARDEAATAANNGQPTVAPAPDPALEKLMPVIEALQQTMMAIAQSQQQLAAAINEPKVVVRDARNQIVGVQPANGGAVH